MELKNLRFQQILGRYSCCWTRDHILENNHTQQILGNTSFQVDENEEEEGEQNSGRRSRPNPRQALLDRRATPPVCTRQSLPRGLKLLGGSKIEGKKN